MNSSTHAAQAALLKTVQDILGRAEVEECLRDMLIDVELSIQLQERIQTHQHIQALQERIQEQEYVIAETKAVRKQTQQHQVAMADALMQEVLVLSIELGTLKETKQQHEKLLMQYDELVAKLTQFEEDRSNAVESNVQERTNDGTTSSVENHDVIVSNLAVDATTETNLAVADSTDEVEDDTIVIKEPPKLIHNDAPEIEVFPNLQISSSMDELDDGTVALVKEFRFDEFEKDIFLKIFGFLDAIDILNTAQINVSMYSRVDSFFDFGDSTIQDEGEGSTTVQIEQAMASLSTPSNEHTKPPPSAITSIIHQPTVVSLPPVVSTKTSTTTALPSLATITKPDNTNFATPTTTTTTTATIANIMAIPSLTSPPKHVPSKSNDSALLNRTIFSLLQPRQRPSTNIAASTAGGNGSISPVPSPARNFLRPLTDQLTNHTTTSGSAANTATSGAVTMNAAMANSMAAKLSDAELNAIILMTERLKQKEIIADKLTKENETLHAKLDGTEGVKQFLINKVRDMEVSLSALIQNETKVVQQIASDQEVIAFLDGRVQELEHTTRAFEADKEATKTELERVQKQSGQKVTVISDMLQFEREKLVDQEREWKMTKRLLVKEIKNCRSQIIALQSERDGYREQSDTLRRALLSPSSSNNHSMNHGNTNGNSSKHHHRDRSYA